MLCTAMLSALGKFFIYDAEMAEVVLLLPSHQAVALERVARQRDLTVVQDGRMSERKLPRLARMAFVFVNGFFAVAVVASLAVLCHTSWVFPSVGPTAFLLYSMPTSLSACPRNTLCGHALGIACGYGSLVLTGLEQRAAANLDAVQWPRMLAAAVSLAATSFLMIAFRVVHPPAGATTLIVSLGFITSPLHLCVMECAILLMTLQALAVNRMAGVCYPFWSGPTSGAGTSLPAS